MSLVRDLLSRLRVRTYVAVFIGCAWLLVGAACGQSTAKPSYTIVTILPTSGEFATIGLALQHATDLAVQQHSALPHGAILTVTHIDANGVDLSKAMTALVANTHVVGIVGPLMSQDAITIVPIAAAHNLAMLSPGATLPGLTLADQAAAEGVPFTALHPANKPLAFFRLVANDAVLGTQAAKLAVASVAAHGLAAQSVFVVQDGSASGKVLAASFTQTLSTEHGSVVNQQLLNATTDVQGLIAQIVAAEPDLVFYAGDPTLGAKLRSTLSLSGVPQLNILMAGIGADMPDWSTTVGVIPASAYTTALVPAPDLSTLPTAPAFTTAYHTMFPGQAMLPQSALGYDATMVAITAIQTLLTQRKPVTSAAVLAVIKTTSAAGVTGQIAFDHNGDRVTLPGLGIYSCDIKGQWQFVAAQSA